MPRSARNFTEFDDLIRFAGFLGLVFAVSFLTSFLVMRLVQQQRIDHAQAARQAPAPRPAAPMTWEAAMEQKPTPYEQIFEDRNEGGAVVQAERANVPSTRPLDHTGHVPFDSNPARIRSVKFIEPKPLATAHGAIPVPTSAAIDAAVWDEVPQGDDTGVGIDGTLAAMAQETIEYTQGHLIDVDAFVRFGLQLFISGAAGELARHNAWTETQGRQELIAAGIALGAPPQQAEDYATAANTFAQVESFRFMIDGGIAEMNARLGEAQDKFATLPVLLNSWNLLQQDVPLPEPHTVLVMAVNLKPQEGVETVPEVWRSILRNHKNFCAELIASSGGKVLQEITTGVALAFDTPELAVRTAVELQEQSDIWARNWKPHTISIEIGIDTALGLEIGGNVISVAQGRATRLLRLTQPNQILCTAPVQSSHVGSEEFTPEAFGEDTEGLPPVFSIAWTRARAAETAAVEYRHIGTAEPATAATAETKALDSWMAAGDQPTS